MASYMEYENSVKIMLWTWNIGTLSCNKLEICNELWKGNVDLCGLQKVRWSACGGRLTGVQGMKYKLRWSGLSKRIFISPTRQTNPGRLFT